MTIPTVRVTESRRWAEALPGGLTFNDLQDRLRDELMESFGTADGMCSIWIRDMTDEWVVYEVSSGVADELFQVSYSVDDTGAVTITGEPTTVDQVTTFVPDTEDAAEAVVRVPGRVLEAKGTDSTGGRVFSVQIIETGISRNGVRYNESCLTQAAPLYEGAKAFDHHRTDDELKTSTVVGLVGHYRNVAANAAGITGDLHLLPSAAHTAEALEASLAAQTQGLPPIVGISHDVQMSPAPTPKLEAGRTIREATSIVRVLSADVVADPSAGGRVTRMVAGGLGTESTPEPKDMTMTYKELLALLRGADAEKRAELLKEHAAVIEVAGFTVEEVTADLDAATPPAESEKVLVTAGAPTEEVAESYDRDSLRGRSILREALADTNLPPAIEQRIRTELPERFTEADATRAVSLAHSLAGAFEVGGLAPTVGHVAITTDERDKKTEKLLESFRGNYTAGYSKVSDAFYDITGINQYNSGGGVEGMARQIIKESWQAPTYSGERLSEAVTSTSWGNVLADAMNRRVVEVFAGSWDAWRKVAKIVPLNDFRSQKLIEVSEYSTLPTVLEGGAYQPLTSPSNVQNTYVPTKKGGTDSFTYEAARNDDMRVLASIPDRLARLVAFTIYNTIFQTFVTNPVLASDSLALFHASHNNTTASTTLSNAGLDTLRQKMRAQTAYGDSTRANGLLPKFLLVPNALEDLANQLTRGDRAVPATTPGPTDVPNLHGGMEPIVLDVWTDANDYIVIADPMDQDVIEIGFLDGKVDPELFVQDDPRTGTPFSSDEVTWKVRSIWGIGLPPSAFKGAQRMTN